MRYESARARNVRLAVVDRSGATWFTTTFAPGRGVAQIPAPPAGPNAPYTLVTSAAQGRERAETRVQVPTAAVPAAPHHLTLVPRE